MIIWYSKVQILKQSAAYSAQMSRTPPPKKKSTHKVNKTRSNYNMNYNNKYINYNNKYINYNSLIYTIHITGVIRI